MEDADRNTIHGTAELSSGNREDLFSPTVTDTLINIVCAGCGCVFPDHYSWEEHIRDMVETEDTDHNFYTQAVDGQTDNVVLEGQHQCPDCGNSYKTEEERDNHRLTVGTSVRLVCSQCASLVPDMELHIPKHKSDSKCGECGGKMANVMEHMVARHSGFMSVLIMQTIRCGGDGTSLISLEIVLATNARFLASEVKPFEPEEELEEAEGHKEAEQEEEQKKKGKKRKLTEPESQQPEIPDKRPATGIKVKEEFMLKKEDCLVSMEDEFMHSFNLSDEISYGEPLKIVSPKKKKSKKVRKEDPEKDHLEYEISERDRALCPPPFLPEEFFNEDGTRSWAKLPARKGLHQCELCGFNAKTKNKYREKQDHLMKWHFSKRIEKILPSLGKKPFYCPLCPFMGKDRQCVVRHYTGKHQALDVWMAEFLDAVTFKTLTEDTLNTVENVDILGLPNQLQKPYRGKIVNTASDLKDFLDINISCTPVNEEIACDQCEETFPSLSALKSHTLIDHNTKSRYERDLTSRAEVISAVINGNSALDYNDSDVPNVEIVPAISITPLSQPIDVIKSKRLRDRLEREQEQELEERRRKKEQALERAKQLEQQEQDAKKRKQEMEKKQVEVSRRSASVTVKDDKVIEKEPSMTNPFVFPSKSPAAVVTPDKASIPVTSSNKAITSSSKGSTPSNKVIASSNKVTTPSSKGSTLATQFSKDSTPVTSTSKVSTSVTPSSNVSKPTTSTSKVSKPVIPSSNVSKTSSAASNVSKPVTSIKVSTPVTLSSKVSTSATSTSNTNKPAASINFSTTVTPSSKVSTSATSTSNISKPVTAIKVSTPVTPSSKVSTSATSTSKDCTPVTSTRRVSTSVTLASKVTTPVTPSSKLNTPVTPVISPKKGDPAWNAALNERYAALLGTSIAELMEKKKKGLEAALAYKGPRRKKKQATTSPSTSVQEIEREQGSAEKNGKDEAGGEATETAEQAKMEVEGEANKDNLLVLEDEADGGLRCLSCTSNADAILKSISELKDHIQKNHMDLCLDEYFVACQTTSSINTQPPKKFTFTLCCLCGKCFSQNSPGEVLEKHRSEHKAKPS